MPPPVILLGAGPVQNKVQLQNIDHRFPEKSELTSFNLLLNNSSQCGFIDPARLCDTRHLIESCFR